jgi:hypothetical protein
VVEDGGFVDGDDVGDAVAGVDYDAAAETWALYQSRSDLAR